MLDANWNSFGTINQSLRNKRLAIFCGSGISRNSGLPLVKEIVPCILDKLGLNHEEIEQIIMANMPFEIFMEILSDYSDISPILNIYGLSEPNINHIFIAKLAKHGLINTIYTTNFDLLIERALEMEGLIENVDYKVYYREEDFEDIEVSLCNRNNAFIRLFKIHGSIRINENILDFDSIRTTMKSVSSKTLSDKRQNAIRHLITNGEHDIVLVIGYSCSDILDINVYINSINDKKNSVNVIYQKHGNIEGEWRNEDFDKDIAPFKEFKMNEYPFKDFSGKILVKNTDDFVKEMWINIFNNKYNITPEIRFKVDYLSFIDKWVSQFEENHFNFIIIGNLFRKISDVEKSYENFSKGYEKFNDPYEKLTDADIEKYYRNNGHAIYFLLGHTFLLAEKYTEACDCFRKSLKFCKALGYKKEIAMNYSCIGTIYYRKDDATKALDYLKKSIQIFSEIDDRKEIAACYSEIGTCYSKLGNFYEAIANYQKSAKINKEEGYMEALSECYFNLGVEYAKNHYLVEAKEMFYESLNISSYLGNKSLIAHCNQYIK